MEGRDLTLHTLIVTLAIAVAVWLAAIITLYAFGKPRAARELVTLVPNRDTFPAT